ncbi:unnamed protein product [Notodromas monacha]|uniref:PARP-type domain-containing protein n=1 Tax=Notodromas monacha TaxID=399045 RepID=A0A7R9BQM8_9CRUS|nr:unnamed protein product [Notodromas monacha]CAG0918530.1 unnamed protein product [Notodromas monacha]
MNGSVAVIFNYSNCCDCFYFQRSEMETSELMSDKPFGAKDQHKISKQRAKKAYEVGVSPGNVSCSNCSSNIDPNNLMLRSLSKFSKSAAGWSHVVCLLRATRKGAKKSEIEGYKELESEQKKDLEDLLTRPFLDEFVVEYAKSYESVCRGCGSKIAKGAVRIGKLDDSSEVAQKYGPSYRWHHVECFASARELLGFLKGGYMLSQFESLSMDDKRYVIEQLPTIQHGANDQTDELDNDESVADVLASLCSVEAEFNENSKDDDLFLQIEDPKQEPSSLNLLLCYCDAKEITAVLQPETTIQLPEQDPEKVALAEKVAAMEAQLAELRSKLTGGPVVESSQKSTESQPENLFVSANKSRFGDDAASLVPESNAVVVSGPKPALMTPLNSEKLSQFKENTQKTEKSFEALRNDLMLSSDEEEEMRNPMEQRYNEYGKEVRRISRKQNIVIDYEEKLARMKSKIYLDESMNRKRKGSNTALVNPVSVDNDLGPGGYSEAKTKIRIVTPLIGSIQLETMLKEKVIYTLSTIKMHLRGGKIDTDGDWVVMGVIIGKGHPKISKKGSQFSVLSLSDLTGDCTRVVSVMLFGRAHEKLFKLNLGTVIGLLNPSILENRDGRFGVDATLSVSTPDRVLEIGQSKDYGLCQGRKKDGTACVVPVNKATCQFCVHHLQGEYRKAAAKRQSLNTGLNSVDPKRRFSDKMCLGGNVVCLESSEGLADAKRRKLSMSGLAKNNTAQSLGSVDKLKHLSDAEKTAVTKFRKSDPEL